MSFVLVLECEFQEFALGRANSERSKTIAPEGLVLLLLLIYGVGLGDWVEFGGFVLPTRVFFVLVIEPSVVGMAFADAVFVALGNQFNK
jgi:hypothetical protein